MSSQVEKFVDALRNDENLMQEIGKVIDAETEAQSEFYDNILKFAASKGFDMTREELEAALDEIELTEEEMELVSGGKGDGK